MKRALFIFRRDLRLEDNTGLEFALENADEVILSFIFTPEQIEHNSYRSDHCLQFMIESLESLEKEINSRNGKLYLFFGRPEDVVQECIKALQVDAVIVNRDYTPYSIQRDQHIKHFCQSRGIDFHSFGDLTLHPLEETLKSDGNPYTVFTPYYRNALKLTVDLPAKSSTGSFYTRPVSFAKDHHFYNKILPKRFNQQKGGRDEALKILNSPDKFTDYSSVRDFPAQNLTTHLSPHLKFMTVSSREAYYFFAKHFGRNSDLIRSLYWRDFFISIAYHFPQVFKGAFKEKFNELKWSDNKTHFKLWCDGKTGFPIVDAGMREMNETGFMHNRVRMITASFLVKDLHINWQWGEKYFAQTLIDYDPAVNNGNWQWAASTGCDAQPYFRIFNPWSQAVKFDKECKYIKHWVPELKNLSPDVIHAWNLEKHFDKCPAYPQPIINHSVEAKIALAEYKEAS